jgi:hypothetical protein
VGFVGPPDEWVRRFEGAEGGVQAIGKEVGVGTWTPLAVE